LYVAKSDGTYAELGQAAGVDDPHGRGREAVTLDANRDGLPDIFSDNEQPSNYVELNHLYLKQWARFHRETRSGRDRFVEQSVRTGGGLGR
jgi:hypothetical protein